MPFLSFTNSIWLSWIKDAWAGVVWLRLSQWLQNPRKSGQIPANHHIGIFHGAHLPICWDEKMKLIYCIYAKQCYLECGIPVHFFTASKSSLNTFHSVWLWWEDDDEDGNDNDDDNDNNAQVWYWRGVDDFVGDVKQRDHLTVHPLAPGGLEIIITIVIITIIILNPLIIIRK